MAKQALYYYTKRSYRHARDEDPFQYLNYVDSIQKENVALLSSFDTTRFSTDFNLYIHTYLKYRYVDPRWMFKVDMGHYDENGRPIYKDLPDEYYDFIWAIDLDNQKAYNNLFYLNALDRYLFEALNKPKEIQDKLVVEESFFSRKYHLIKSTFKGKILDFQLTKFMNHYAISALKNEDWSEVMADYKRTCQTPEYIEIVENTYGRSTKLSKGNPAPNFVLENINGDTVSLASLKSKVVFIDFWATWCSPCKSTLFKTEALVEKFKDNENVAILLINIDDKKERWKNYIDTKKIKGLHLFASPEQSKKLFKDFNFNGIPHYILIGKEGEMIDPNAINDYTLERRIEYLSNK